MATAGDSKRYNSPYLSPTLDGDVLSPTLDGDVMWIDPFPKKPEKTKATKDTPYRVCQALSLIEVVKAFNRGDITGEQARIMAESFGALAWNAKALFPVEAKG